MDILMLFAFAFLLVGLPLFMTALFRWMWRNPDKVA